MKKLNNKGFTLVELLAVIIILAIVVGISIPAVLTTTSKAKTNAFQTAANSVATWFDNQYQVAKTGISTSGLATIDENFTEFCKSDGSRCANSAEITKAMAQAVGEAPVEDAAGSISSSSSTAFKKITDERLIAATGVTTQNVQAIYVRIDSTTGRSCVILEAKSKGDYDNAGNNSYSKKKDDGTYSSNTDRIQSSYCPTTK